MIKGKRIILRRASKIDIPKILQWEANYEIFHLIGMPKLTSPEALEEEINQVSISPNRLLFIIETENGSPIGYLSLWNIRWKDRNAYLELVIGEKEYWNKIYGANVYLLILEYAFNVLNLHKIYGEVVEYNKRHIRLIENGGAKKEGVLKEHIFKDGKYYDMYIYGFFKRDYEKTKNRWIKRAKRKACAIKE
ncbi:MAG: GNAT family protein [bacterium]